MTDPISAYLQSRSSDKAAKAQKEAAQASQDTQWRMYNQNREDQMPWLTQGKNSLERLGGMMGKNGALMKQYQAFKPMDMTTFNADPSYNFRRSEGLRGIENSMAGRSGFGGGNILKALARYNSDLASTEYGAANDRYNQNFATGYNQFNQDQNTIFNRLAALSGTGQTTASNLGSMGQSTANAVSGAQSDYGDAAARRYMGRASVYKGIDEDFTKAAGIVLGSKFK